MSLLSAYIVIAALVAVSIFLAANWFRQQHVATPDHAGATAVVAGLLWPALLIGMAELALVCCASRGTRRAPRVEMVSLSRR